MELHSSNVPLGAMRRLIAADAALCTLLLALAFLHIQSECVAYRLSLPVLELAVAPTHLHFLLPLHRICHRTNTLCTPLLLQLHIDYITTAICCIAGPHARVNAEDGEVEKPEDDAPKIEEPVRGLPAGLTTDAEVVQR